MGNCLSKCDNEPFHAHYWTPVTPGHLKDVISGVWKNRVKFLVKGIHRNPIIDYLGLSKNASLLNIHGRFPPQSFQY